MEECRAMPWLSKNDESGFELGRWGRGCNHVCLVLLVAAFGLAAPSQAAVIEVAFTGIVASVGTDLAGGPIDVGNEVSGRFSYNTPAPNTGVGNIGIYDDVVTSYNATVGGYEVAMVGSTDFRVGNDQTSIPNPFDSLIVNAVALSGPELNALSPVRLQFGLYSTDLTRVLSTDLPDVDALLRFAASDGRTNFNFLTFGSGFERQVRWNLTSFTPTVIPEPGIALLLGGGLMALSLRGRTR